MHTAFGRTLTVSSAVAAWFARARETDKHSAQGTSILARTITKNRNATSKAHRNVMEALQSTADSIVAGYATYEEYLDSQISAKDLYYLEDEDLARQLVELGYRGGELKREEFEQRKKNAENIKSKKSNNLLPKVLASSGREKDAVIANSPFLQALAEREEMVRTGKLAVSASTVPFSPECSVALVPHTYSLHNLAKNHYPKCHST